jgi:PAS domain S-box-containing protein
MAKSRVASRFLVTNDPRISAFDALPSAILVWEYDPPLASAADLRLVAANLAAEGIGPQWPMRELVGRRRSEIQPSIDALDELYLAVARTGRTHELRGLRDPQGAIFDARVFPLPGQRLAVSFDNVTERRQVEEAHRAIFERAHDAILIIDPDTEVILEAGPAALALYGRDVVGVSMFELSRNHRPGMSQKILDEGFVQFQTTHVRADGRDLHLDVHARSIVYNGRSVVAGISRDITEEVEARRSLEASEEKYRALIANVPVLIWTADAEGGSEFLSGSVFPVTGFTREEMSTELWLSRLHPDDLPRVSSGFQALIADGVPLAVEYRYLRKNGRWAWLYDQAAQSYLRDGRRLVDGVTQDITDRKRGELQQLALAELGRRALAYGDDQSLIDDACRIVVDVLEVPKSSVLLLDATEDAFFVAAACGVKVTPEFRVPNEPTRLAAQTFARREVITYDNIPEERRFDTSDMVRLDTRAGVCVPIAGRTRGFGVMHAHTNEPREFTAREAAFLQSIANILAEALQRSSAERELHDAAEEWRDTFDSIQAPLVIAGDGARLTRMNAAALRLSHYRDYTPAIGQPVASLGDDAIWKDIDALARASADRDQAIFMQGVAADGRSWDLLASRSTRGQTIIIATDVTELVRMQDKLLRTERMSEMGALVAGVAHEVRNPLFGISATLDAFENKYGSEQFRGYTSALREQVDRMSALMHALLEYGRPLASPLQPQCIAVVINSAVANAGTLARQHGVTLRSTVPPELVPVPMDRNRMVQVFDNLIANAVQHSRDGGVVAVSAEVSTDEKRVRIAVEDRGPGFRDDDLLRVFEPFFTRRRGGTGLGLSLVRRIVEEHGGTVTAANREEGGAAMLVTLPIAEGN